MASARRSTPRSTSNDTSRRASSTASSTTRKSTTSTPSRKPVVSPAVPLADPSSRQPSVGRSLSVRHAVVFPPGRGTSSPRSAEPSAVRPMGVPKPGRPKGAGLPEARIQASLLHKDLFSEDPTRTAWALHRVVTTPAYAGRSREALTRLLQRYQRKHALQVIAHEWGAPTWDALVTALSASARDRILRLRGAWVDGHTSEDVARVGSQLLEWVGLHVVVVWSFWDMWGTGGDSEPFTAQGDGRSGKNPDGSPLSFGRLPDGLWEFLTDPDSDVDPEVFRDAAFIPVRRGDTAFTGGRPLFRHDAYNYAVEKNTRTELG